MTAETFAAPRGTRDVLPPASERMRALTAVFAEQAGLRGYRQVISPLFENVEVFRRVGETTEVISKEMYEFRDKDDRLMALRPELTASLARAFVEHLPPTPWKVWYEGPQFRYEKPQAGRYRQFNQVGAELIGTDDPQADIETISLAWSFCTALGLRQISLLLNSLGEPEDRRAYQKALADYFADRTDELSQQGRATLARDPLRLLDSKRPQDQAAAAQAPDPSAYRSEKASSHFEAVRAGLERLNIPFVSDPKLVRGLDYYQHTTFELRSATLNAAQDAIGGGGRYNGLIADLGGPPTPGIGFALGTERLLLACDAEGAFPPPEQPPEVFVIDLTGGREATHLAEELRQAGISTQRAFDGRSMKAQMKTADRSGARYALLIGPTELERGAVTLRDLRRGAEPKGRGAEPKERPPQASETPEPTETQTENHPPPQTTIDRSQVLEELQRLLKAPKAPK